ncbi:hypothetical protein [Clostridium algidicarnis]|uniref:Uncharacterized protein n=2 Tax=Clostridium algidicarnis TaxID=37659 RepID=A0A2S6FW61_9CLOT|nr:hypothetical protein [Clostridium algidicarnis]MBB6631097.1 hypothetical protein [Clostridium algidicarnis]MBB6696619.1 hypothetical protein [Clostridium algidicarnis]MBU3194316.1 hypothetical protein [Clostridium algidicarnis]MBU3207454.1 hypothetical protein [Clostridium algidicarnis]MBU3220721.1 hypothetical protein [Clostridium algidicarnis]
MLMIQRFVAGNDMNILVSSVNNKVAHDVNVSAQFNKLYMHDLGIRF